MNNPMETFTVISAMMDDIKKLEAENARYREALEFFLAEYKSDTKSLVKLAREALKGGE